MIKTVIVWQNRMVMVFDAAGNQMAQYQGPLSAVRETILRDSNAETIFKKGLWEGTFPKPNYFRARQSILRISRHEFELL